ncbi:MAG: hypothetical protein ACTHN3_14165 [Solirubrobacterales bacterium]
MTVDVDSKGEQIGEALSSLKASLQAIEVGCRAGLGRSTGAPITVRLEVSYGVGDPHQPSCTAERANKKAATQ